MRNHRCEAHLKNTLTCCSLYAMRKLGGLYTPRYIPYGFHMEWVDSNPIPWTAYGRFFGWQPSHFFIPYPPWSPYGIHMEWTIPWTFHGHSMFWSMWIPCGFHGISNEFTLKIYVLFHMDSMEESTSNSVEEPSIVLSKIVSSTRIEPSTSQHVTCARRTALLRLSHASVTGQYTTLP